MTSVRQIQAFYGYRQYSDIDDNDAFLSIGNKLP